MNKIRIALRIAILLFIAMFWVTGLKFMPISASVGLLMWIIASLWIIILIVMEIYDTLTKTKKKTKKC